LKALRARELLKELGSGWRLNGNGHLERRYTFKDFAQTQFCQGKLPGSVSGSSLIKQVVVCSMKGVQPMKYYTLVMIGFA
jgi:hypothetical protein